tara:strand:+ start:66 stop:278 length:213 start_codon:yes stop_codon:yes gene_type:complete
LGDFDKGETAKYTLKNNDNGLYVFILEGSVNASDVSLERRDGLALWEVEEIDFKFEEKSKVLLMEVPLAN